MGYNLPPGVTEADIDRHFGGEDPLECQECGAAEQEPGGTCEECAEYACVSEPQRPAPYDLSSPERGGLVERYGPFILCATMVWFLVAFVPALLLPRFALVVAAGPVFLCLVIGLGMAWAELLKETWEEARHR